MCAVLGHDAFNAALERGKALDGRMVIAVLLAQITALTSFVDACQQARYVIKRCLVLPISPIGIEALLPHRPPQCDHAPPDPQSSAPI